MLTLPQVLPGLPSKGIAASVDPLPWCSEVVREFLVDPESFLIEPSPSVPSRTKLWAAPAAAKELGDHLLDIGMLYEIPDEERIPKGADGKPLRLGGFGVKKAKSEPVEVNGSFLSVLRLVLNAIPINGCLIPLLFDCLQLSGPVQFSGIKLFSRRGWLLTVADRSAFYYGFCLKHP